MQLGGWGNAIVSSFYSAVSFLFLDLLKSRFWNFEREICVFCKYVQAECECSYDEQTNTQIDTLQQPSKHKTLDAEWCVFQNAT